MLRAHVELEIIVQKGNEVNFLNRVVDGNSKEKQANFFES